MQIRSGIINIYKEAGYTSFDVVARLRGILRIRKIGHTGTLDPDAVGVLPVCIGKATKVCDLLTNRDKEYETVLRLGVETDTQDMTGEVLATSSVEVSPDQVRQVIDDFVGEISQIPPMYSALKVQGQKLCDLARKGMVVEREPRTVQIYGIQILEMELPRIRMRVQCSKGTYIRTLCHDIGRRLGCGGAMESLMRTRAAGFLLQDAHTLDEVEALAAEDELDPYLIPVDSLFADHPGFRAKEQGDRLLVNGNKLNPSLVQREGEHGYADTTPDMLTEGMKVRMYRHQGAFAGIYQWKDGMFVPQKMFLD